MMHEPSRFTLPAVPPFRLDLTVWALRRRAANIVDRWDGNRYSRTIISGDAPVKMTAVQEGTRDKPTLSVTLQSHHAVPPEVQEDIRSLLEKMLGLSLDLRPFYAMAGADGILGPLAHRFSGVRPPRFPGIFEALINAIACQQVTLDLGILIMNRLSERFGQGFEDEGRIAYAFPRPEDFRGAPEEYIQGLGLTRQKAKAIKELSDAFLDHRVDETALASMSNPDAAACLSSLRGIGRWSAEYVLLRGLGRLDCFPGDDAGAQGNLQRLFHLSRRPDYDEIRKLASTWHPYEGFVYFHLLLEKLRLKGVIQG